ncbi:MAG: zinc ribbon-containing protein [Clostridiales bacterium]|nr:zinc ribbon-containing protein [Clostridiales bacterium]
MDGNWSIYYKCDTCGSEKSVLIGSGWGGPFPETVASDVEKGRYGQKWKELFVNTPGAEVEENMELYVCPACHHFQNEINLTMYIPKKPDEIPEESRISYLKFIKSHKYINKLLSLKRVRYYWEFWQRPYVHRCEECGRRMHLYRRGEPLHCPECKTGLMEVKECNVI